ncbi:septal ring lytic transglycosylase RlpA family protein [Lewinella sp. IMCC34183]|uniref:septal ring lytic transglycosylase RlpA family protein n=1 Tax=Lewinella sp. IMCC34183 TaxID=2248762 RepID=UPI000E260276|nr:SPOR domain-containing protein [Lewinella sp. IMCC34183]
MKRLLSISFLLPFSVAGLQAQSFEWNKAPRPTAHPKEVQLDAPADQDKQDGLAGVYAPEADGSTTAYGETYSADAMTSSHSGLPLGTLLRVTNTENGRSVVVRVTDKGKECTDCLITLSQVAAEKLGISDRSSVSLERTGFSNWNPLPPEGDAVPAPATYAGNFPEPAEPKGVIAPPKPTAGTSTAASPRPAVITREVVPAEKTNAPAPETYNRYAVTPPAPTVSGAQQARGVEEVTTAAAPAEQGAYAIQLAAYTNESYALRRVGELKEQGLTDVYYRSVTREDGQVINRVYSGNYGTVTEAQQAAEALRSSYNIAGIVAKK